jgi:hypothetical protein
MFFKVYQCPGAASDASRSSRTAAAPLKDMLPSRFLSSIRIGVDPTYWINSSTSGRSPRRFILFSAPSYRRRELIFATVSRHSIPADLNASEFSRYESRWGNTISSYKQIVVAFPPRSHTLDSRAGANARDLFNKTGAVYQGDCLELLKSIRDEEVHTLFADLPFNL